jgi:hypothetical protein
LGRHQKNVAYFGQAAEDMARQVTYQSVFLLLEMLNLEDFALAADNPEAERPTLYAFPLPSLYQSVYDHLSYSYSSSA